jgi:adenylate kinase
MKKIVLLGPPGCGKGTQSKILVDKFSFFQLSTGDLLREQTMNKNSPYGKEINEIMKRGDLVTDEIVINLIINKVLSLKDENIIFDGFPRNLNQAEVLDQSLREFSIDLDHTILFEVDFKILEERIQKRITESVDDKRSDDNLETLLKRIEVYKNNTLPIVDFYKKKNILKKINGMESIENVNKEILKIIT